nr:hypothetical protein [uncultured Pseudomonas sp.]
MKFQVRQRWRQEQFHLPPSGLTEHRNAESTFWSGYPAGLDEFIGSHAIADTGDYGCHWNEDELRQHFDTDRAVASELEMCRYSAHQILQLESEEERLRMHMTTQQSWMSRLVEYFTESRVPDDLLAEYKAITATRI